VNGGNVETETDRSGRRLDGHAWLTAGSLLITSRHSAVQRHQWLVWALKRPSSSLLGGPVVGHKSHSR